MSPVAGSGPKKGPPPTTLDTSHELPMPPERQEKMLPVGETKKFSLWWLLLLVVIPILAFVIYYVVGLIIGHRVEFIHS